MAMSFGLDLEDDAVGRKDAARAKDGDNELFWGE